MSRTTINTLYFAFVIAMTLVIPALLYFGTDGSLEGTIAAVLSFVVMASYLFYTFLLGARS